MSGPAAAQSSLPSGRGCPADYTYSPSVFARPSGLTAATAGIPNVSGEQNGLITRIATSPPPHPPRYGLVRDDVFIDALAVRYDPDAFLDRFLSRWPAGSPAHASYFDRIVNGPAYSVEQATPKDRS